MNCFEERRTSPQTGGFSYQVWNPQNIQTPCPAILFLHGRGESGTDGVKQTQHGLGAALSAAPDDWPFLVILPQKPDETLWTEHLPMLTAILGDASTQFPIDPSRCYFTGLSQGGHGVLNLVDQLPWTFAAAAAICGWGHLVTWRAFQDIPVRLYHGMKDDVIPYEASVFVGSGSRGLHPDSEIILYPDLGHNCWDRAYQNSGLSQWLLQFKSKGGSR